MVYLYYGENSFIIQENLKAVQAKYLAKYASGLNFWKFDAEENMADLPSVLENQSMFDEKKMILLRGVLSMSEGEWEGFKKLFNKNISTLKSDDVILLCYDFVSEKLDENIKSRLDFLKAWGEAREFKNFNKPQMIDWCLKKSKETNIGVSRSDLAYLIDGVGCDIYRVWNELAKLASYGNGVVSKNNIDDMVSFETITNSFKITEALLQKNTALALKGLEEQWGKNEDPLRVLGALVWQFRILAKLSGDKISSASEAVNKLKLNPWVAQKSVSALKNFTLAELKNIYQNMADADLAIKTGEKDGREALADLVYGFLQA